MERRSFVGASLSAAMAATISRATAAAETRYDYVIIGAGTGGLPAAIYASRRGAKVLLLDAAQDVGGTLHLANGQVSAGGTILQKAKGIVDFPRSPLRRRHAAVERLRQSRHRQAVRR